MIEPDERFCHNCGAPNPDDYTFCVRCGARINFLRPLPAATHRPPGAYPFTFDVEYPQKLSRLSTLGQADPGDSAAPHHLCPRHRSRHRHPDRLLRHPLHEALSQRALRTRRLVQPLDRQRLRLRGPAPRRISAVLDGPGPLSGHLRSRLPGEAQPLAHLHQMVPRPPPPIRSCTSSASSPSSPPSSPGSRFSSPAAIRAPSSTTSSASCAGTSAWASTRRCCATSSRPSASAQTPARAPEEPLPFPSWAL